MNRRTLFQAILIMVLLLLLAAGLSQTQKPAAADSQPLASALGTSFTYQGQLVYNGAPVNDTCNFTFSLWDEAGTGEPPSGGNQINSDVTLTGVSVGDGLFTVSLDFGTGAFTGEARWLEIDVVCSSISAILSPRQPLTPVPYSLRTTDADTVDGQHAGDFAAAGTVWSLTGNAGTTPGTHFLGTTDGQALELHVNGSRALRLEPNAISPNLIGGYSGNSVSSEVLGATINGGGASGFSNRVTDDYGTVGGGSGSRAGNDSGTAGDAGYATVGGGRDNYASADSATVGGGFINLATAPYATVGGGYYNWATGSSATMGGGYDNTADAEYATVGGGYSNYVHGSSATVGGGYDNTANAEYATVGGDTSITSTVPTPRCRAV